MAASGARDGLAGRRPFEACPTWPVCWPWLPPVAGLLGFAATMAVPWLLGDPDTYWHLAAGRWIVAHGAVPTADPFSWTYAGRPWSAHEWGAELLFWAAYRAAGWSGVVVLSAAAAGASLVLLGRALDRLPGAAAAMLLLLAGCAMERTVLARPHLLALPLLVVWCAGLIRARDRERAPPLALLPVMALWANLHGGFMVGLALLPPLGLEALIAARGRRASALLAWGGFGGLATLAAAMTPRGWDTLLFPFRLMQMAQLGRIDEWRRLDLTRPQPIMLMAAGILYLVLFRRLRLSPVRGSLLLVLGIIAVQQGRNQLLAGMIGPLLLADPLARCLLPGGVPRGGVRAGTARLGTGLRLSPGAFSGAFLAAFLGAALLATLRVAYPVRRGNADESPVVAFAALPDALRSLPGLNDYSFGGYLIFNGVAPFIDGRADMYGDAFLARYVALLEPDGAALRRLLDETPVAWTLLMPDSAMAATMDRLPGWHRLHADTVAVIHVRDPAPPARD